MTSHLVPAALLATLVSACAGSSKQVPGRGTTTDRVHLVGNWEGEYEGLQSGRRGTILFELATGHPTAQGRVVMVPAGTGRQPQPLAIEFVQVDETQVSGTIAPYEDPQCDCMVRTEFEGAVRGDLINGTFVTYLLDTDQQQAGWWSVSRRN
jgi:hypothetical protein